MVENCSKAEMHEDSADKLWLIIRGYKKDVKNEEEKIEKVREVQHIC